MVVSRALPCGAAPRRDAAIFTQRPGLVRVRALFGRAERLSLTLPPVLVFDLDGTLVDTAPDLMVALNVVLRHEGLREVSLDEATGMVGAGARALVERGLAATGAARSTAEIDALFEIFLEHYSAHIADGSRPYPGVLAAMERFSAEGWKLAVCTNKLEGLSRLLLNELGIEGRFAAIAGGDTFDVRKPDAKHLRETIALAGGDPARSVMVGDSDTDIATAKNAGIPVVAVDFGYTSIPVRDLNPERVISHFDELYDAVEAVRPRG